MALTDKLERQMIADEYKYQCGKIEHNNVLFNIHEGDLLSYVLCDLKKQLSEKSFEQISHRVAPINVLKRLIDKLSKLYAKPPKRVISNEADKDLLDYYVNSYDLNTVGGMANAFFNLFKTSAFEPYVYNGVPKLRTMPSDRFFVISTDKVNPLNPTHFVKIMGKINTPGSYERTLFYVYTDNEFLAMDDTGEILSDEMRRLGSDGTNPIGKIPFVYINRSRHELVPQIDTDTLCMTKLIPVLLSDINYAQMFQAFSIVYGINLDQEGLKMAPNAFWSLKSDPAFPEAKPEVGVIKPQVDSDKSLASLKAQMALWMQTRNIKPGAMGDLTVENAASGIAKAIDEIDTSEDRAQQIPYFVEAEKQLWDLTINYLHPYWQQDPEFENKLSFSPGSMVTTTFQEQKPVIDQSKLIDDEIKKLNAGLQTKEGALKAIYPDYSDAQIEELLSSAPAPSVATPQANGAPNQ